MSTIGLTPTWGEVGNSLWYLATSGQTVALNHMRSEHARALRWLRLCKAAPRLDGGAEGQSVPNLV